MKISASAFFAVAMAGLVTMPGSAAPAAKTAETRLSTLLVFGNDPCPQSTEDEVVVCARQPESERYRIPKQFRGRQYNAARDGSWAGTARVLEYVSTRGLPGSCSFNGTAGQTGCFRRFLEENRR
jgi:hypothetical protein